MKSYESKHFEFLLPNRQEWFSPKEVAAIIGKSDQFVRDSFDNQKILGHCCNARAKKGKEQRKSYQIHRESIILYLLETANYTQEDFFRRLKIILANRSVEQLQFVREWISGQIVGQSSWWAK